MDLNTPKKSSQEDGSRSPRRINQAGLEIIKQFETLQLNAYVCPAGKLTIGYGHTASVSLFQTITEEEAERLLQADCSNAEDAVRNYVTAPLTDNQFSALVSLVFNIGQGAFRRSTLLKRLNKGDYGGASAQFLVWRKSGPKVLAGLVKRREAEQSLFNTGD